MAAAPHRVLRLAMAAVSVCALLLAAAPAALAAAYNCTQLHPQCTACGMKPVGQTAALMLKCTSCASPYLVFNTASTTACACAAGFWNIDALAKGRCVACPIGSWCKVCCGGSLARTRPPLPGAPCPACVLGVLTASCTSCRTVCVCLQGGFSWRCADCPAPSLPPPAIMHTLTTHIHACQTGRRGRGSHQGVLRALPDHNGAVLQELERLRFQARLRISHLGRHRRRVCRQHLLVRGPAQRVHFLPARAGHALHVVHVHRRLCSAAWLLLLGAQDDVLFIHVSAGHRQHDCMHSPRPRAPLPRMRETLAGWHPPGDSLSPGDLPRRHRQGQRMHTVC